MKVLLPELAVTLGMERFLREIDVGTVLQHPRIVGVLDSGQADGVLYYVMPFVDGATLRDKLNREKQLSVDDTILDHAAGRGRARVRALQGRHPSRHQAGEHPAR